MFRTDIFVQFLLQKTLYCGSTKRENHEHVEAGFVTARSSLVLSDISAHSSQDFAPASSSSTIKSNALSPPPQSDSVDKQISSKNKTVKPKQAHQEKETVEVEKVQDLLDDQDLPNQPVIELNCGKSVMCRAQIECIDVRFCPLDSMEMQSDISKQDSTKSPEVSDIEDKICPPPPAAPPPPPPGFLVPVTTAAADKPVKPVKPVKPMSACEKALITELESINDPTFVGFLKSQLKVKSFSRDRIETEHEM